MLISLICWSSNASSRSFWINLTQLNYLMKCYYQNFLQILWKKIISSTKFLFQIFDRWLYLMSISPIERLKRRICFPYIYGNEKPRGYNQYRPGNVTNDALSRWHLIQQWYRILLLACLSILRPVELLQLLRRFLFKLVTTTSSTIGLKMA